MTCDPAAWLSATGGNNGPRRLIVLEPYRYVGMGHQTLGIARWLELVLHTSRSIRFGVCVPSRLHASLGGHRAPRCEERSHFELLRHLSFANLSNLRATADDDFSNVTVERRLSCARLRVVLSGPSPRALVHSMHARELERCTSTEAFSCLRRLKGTPPADAPPCDFGLHLRTLGLDNSRCNLVRGQHKQPARGGCPERRLSRCPEVPFPSSISGCGGRLFATSDVPAIYKHTRALGWLDLNESVHAATAHARRPLSPRERPPTNTTAGGQDVGDVLSPRCQGGQEERG